MDDRPLRIAMFAGESSGDRQGAALLEALRERVAPRAVQAWGIGGTHMSAAGVSLRHNSEPWASIGIVTTLALIPRLLSVMADVKRTLRADPPDALVLIDAGAINVPLARWAKEQRVCPVFYYFPPGSWRRGGSIAARRRGRHNMAEVTDRIVTPFPWSEQYLQGLGADAHWVGHPLLDLVVPTLSDADFYRRFGLDPHRPLIALMPGSRRLELRYILPTLVSAAGEIARRIPSAQFALALAPSAPRDRVEEMIRREQRPGGRAARLQLLMHQAGDRIASFAQSTLTPPLPRLATNEGLTLPPAFEESAASVRERSLPAQAPLVICEGLPYDVMARSDLVLTKSGTATLEAAILNKPMIIVYRGPGLMALEWRLRRRRLNVTHIGLPNILAQERLVPELLQDEASPEAIADLAVGMLFQPERLMAVKERLAGLVRSNLGELGGVRRAAELLYETATRYEHNH